MRPSPAENMLIFRQNACWCPKILDYFGESGLKTWNFRKIGWFSAGAMVIAGIMGESRRSWLGFAPFSCTSLSLRHGRFLPEASPAGLAALQRLFRTRLCPKASFCPQPGTKKPRESLIRRACFVIRLGFEPKTHSLEGCCSIQLSYRTSPSNEDANVPK